MHNIYIGHFFSFVFSIFHYSHSLEEIFHFKCFTFRKKYMGVYLFIFFFFLVTSLPFFRREKDGIDRSEREGIEGKIDLGGVKRFHHCG